MRAVTSLRAVRRWGLAVAAIVVAIAVAVGAGVRGLYLPQNPASSSAAIAGTSLAPSAQPGPPGVQMSPDAAAHPDAAAVKKLLQTFFDSISKGDYEQWKTAVTSDRARYPEAQWHNDYQSSKDGSIAVYRIEPGDGGLRVLVSFTSTQNPDKAPPNLQLRCLRWWLVYHLVWENNALKMAVAPEGNVRSDSC